MSDFDFVLRRLQTEFHRLMGHMYPQGSLGMPMEQKRDLIRVFCAGAWTADEKNMMLMQVCDSIRDPHWEPEVEWDWEA